MLVASEHNEWPLRARRGTQYWVGGYWLAIGATRAGAPSANSKIVAIFNVLIGAPDTIRTCGLCLRRAKDRHYRQALGDPGSARKP